MGTSLEGSIEGRREDAPDCRLEIEVGESSTDGRRKEAKEVGLVSSEVRRDMVYGTKECLGWDDKMGERAKSTRGRGHSARRYIKGGRGAYGRFSTEESHHWRAAAPRHTLIPIDFLA